jgi:tRNA A37 threonylcarbamoyltransferase TsaD
MEFEYAQKLKERSLDYVSFKKLSNLCASLEQGAFAQIEHKLQIVLNYCLLKDIPLNSVAVVGKFAHNKKLVNMISDALTFWAHDDSQRVNHTSAAVDSNGAPLNDASLTAWMAWELKMKD